MRSGASPAPDTPLIHQPAAEELGWGQREGELTVGVQEAERIHIIANRNFSSMWRGANTTLELLLGAGQTPLSMVKDQDLSPQ